MIDLYNTVRDARCGDVSMSSAKELSKVETIGQTSNSEKRHKTPSRITETGKPLKTDDVSVTSLPTVVHSPL
jgi:hypothetical protein